MILFPNESVLSSSNTLALNSLWVIPSCSRSSTWSYTSQWANLASLQHCEGNVLLLLLSSLLGLSAPASSFPPAQWLTNAEENKLKEEKKHKSNLWRVFCQLGEIRRSLEGYKSTRAGTGKREGGELRAGSREGEEGRSRPPRDANKPSYLDCSTACTYGCFRNDYTML